MGIKVLSLFDGMSGGNIALRQLGIIPVVYYASEIDKHAIAQTQLNFPDTVQLGDVTAWRSWDIPWAEIDIILAGSPCQGFSFAGKQLAFNDPRSALFFVFIDILNHARKHNPGVKFLLENVNMKREHMKVINDYCGLFPVNINSALVSAQNRDRWYWSNIRTRQEGLFGEIHTDIPQPADRGILLRDILEDEVDEKYYLNDKAINYITDSMRLKKKFTAINGDKALTLTAKGITNWTGSYIATDTICISSNQAHASVEINKSTPMVAAMGMGGGHVPMIIQRPRGNNPGGTYESKSPTLSSNAWEQNNHVIQLNPSKESGGIQPYQQNRVYDTIGKSPALLAGMSCGAHAVLDDYRIRRLTPTECARLQTIPAWYKWECSDTQIYRMLGNGWTVEVIMWILSFWDVVQELRKNSIITRRKA